MLNIPANLKEHLSSHLSIIRERIVESEIDLRYDNISTLTGVTARLVFLAELISSNQEKDGALREGVIEEVLVIVKYIETERVEFFNVNGLAGFGWGMSFISQNCNLFFDENELLKDLDTFLYKRAKQDLINNNYDFFYGGIGYIKYFLQRMDSNHSIRPLVETLIPLLIGKAQKKLGFPLWQSENNYKEDMVDLSLSHGMTSIMMVLLESIEKGVQVDLCSETLKNCCMYFNSYQKDKNARSRIPDYIQEDIKFYSPLRWCHGELGMSYALLRAGTTLNLPKIKKQGELLSEKMASLEMRKNQGLMSSTICHGTLGVAHMFKRICELNEKGKIQQEAALYWYSKSIEIMNSNIEYKYFDDDEKFRQKTGVLFGVEGIGLALCSALNNSASKWDKTILLT